MHCALGHGRSATVVAAWRMARGARGGPAEIEDELRRIRPSVGFTDPQKAALAAWRDRVG